MPLALTFGAGDVRVLEQHTAWSGHFAIRQLTLQHRLFAGGWSEPLVREVFERGDAVGVLPYDPVSDSLVMIEQFRPGAMRGDDSPWMLELIAGIVEPGESATAVAHREAMEEAGCELSELLPIATVLPSAGGEDILVHSVSRRDALQLLADDRIPNGHTLIALQWLHIHGESLRERWC